MNNTIDITDFIYWFWESVLSIWENILYLLARITIWDGVSLLGFLMTCMIISVAIPILFNLEREKSVRSGRTKKVGKKNEK